MCCMPNKVPLCRNLEIVINYSAAASLRDVASDNRQSVTFCVGKSS